MHDNLRSLDLIKQYCKSERLKGLMIGVDARKAFDSVDHNYMQGVLEAYGFGPKCKNWFKLLSKNLKANILVIKLNPSNRRYRRLCSNMSPSSSLLS